MDFFFILKVYCDSNDLDESSQNIFDNIKDMYDIKEPENKMIDQAGDNLIKNEKEGLCLTIIVIFYDLGPWIKLIGDVLFS